MMSAVKPLAPLGSLALKVMTQVGDSLSSKDISPSLAGSGVVKEVGFAISSDFAVCAD